MNSAFATAAMRSSVFATPGSNVTRASAGFKVTLARVTPGTANSADRTVAAQPSHIMPSITRVTVVSFGFAGF